MEVRIEQSWKEALAGEFGKPYFESLVRFLHAEKAAGATIFPPGSQIFRAFDLTPVKDVKVVILGQDPYHGPGQAHGLCFSVLPGIEPPPSLKNIFKELEDDLKIPAAKGGTLIPWAKQGVLMLNNVLTVRAGQAASHHNVGWENFTDRVISELNNKKTPVVFLLWGSPAAKKADIITNPIHIKFKAPHPSPLSAYRGFFGCRHFSLANEFLKSNGLEPIDWRIE